MWPRFFFASSDGFDRLEELEKQKAKEKEAELTRQREEDVKKRKDILSKRRADHQERIKQVPGCLLQFLRRSTHHIGYSMKHRCNSHLFGCSPDPTLWCGHGSIADMASDNTKMCVGSAHS